MSVGLERTRAQVERYVDRMVRFHGIPGIQLAVTGSDKTLCSLVRGYSDLASRNRVRPQTLFQIGSVSKSFTSIVILQMQEEGLLDIDVPVSKYLPWLKLKSKWGPVTLKHLMSHTAGIVMGSDFSLSAFGEAMAIQGMRVSAKPGTFFHYSNTGYKILGLVIEELLNEPNGRIVERRILRPLKMNSSFGIISNNSRKYHATGYSAFYDDRPQPRAGLLAPSVWFESETADGSITSTASDMTNYLRVLINRGRHPHGRIMSDESFTKLTEKLILPSDSPHGEHYGLGIDVGDRDGHMMLSHSGGMLGFCCYITVDMDDSIGAVLLANSVSGDSWHRQIAEFACSCYKAQVRGKRLPEMPDPESQLLVRDLRQFAGMYTSGDRRIVVKAKGRGLVVQTGRGSASLEPIRPDTFYTDKLGFELFDLRFERQNGRVTELVHGGDWYAGARYKGERAFTTPRASISLVGHYRSHDPWQSNFRIVTRKGALWFVPPHSKEEPLTRLMDGSFRIGSDKRSPERIWFDCAHRGRTMRAIMPGGEWYRMDFP